MSLLCNETTNICVTKQLIVYLCYVIEGDLAKSEIFQNNNVTADTIKDTLLSITQEAEIPMSKIIGLGAMELQLVAGVE